MHKRMDALDVVGYIGDMNDRGQRLLEFAERYKLVVASAQKLKNYNMVLTKWSNTQSN